MQPSLQRIAYRLYKPTCYFGCIFAKTNYAESDVQNALLVLYNSETEFQERYIDMAIYHLVLIVKLSAPTFVRLF